MLSVVDLLDAGTLSPDLAAYLLAAIGNGASFMVGAVPGGAGKTTVMGALLNFVPAGVFLAPADGPESVSRGLDRAIPRTCFICHEIGRGGYYAYLWGDPLRMFFRLSGAGHIMATNLHADNLEQARAQICGSNGVPEEDFLKMNLALFLSAKGGMREITDVLESDGKSAHVCVYSGGRLRLDSARLADPDRVRAAGEVLRELTASGARDIRQVRSSLLKRPIST